MPGFYVSDAGVETAMCDVRPQYCRSVEKLMPDHRAIVQRRTLDKFMDDKAFSQSEDGLVVVEGYLLNKRSLLEKYQVGTVAELAMAMYRREGDIFFAQFRGCFSGILYDRKEDKWLVYTNQTGESPVFYALYDEGFYAGSQMTYVLEALDKAGHDLHLDEDSAYQLLTFAFMERDNTIAQEIKRLRAGMYLRVVKGKAEVREYHRFHKHPERFAGYSDEELIEEIEKAFRHAVEQEYEKDEEYGLEHLADMSGGLDSRMSMWLAHELKPRKLQLLTVSKANYLDEKIAKKIAMYWKDELLIKPLDDMRFMYDIDEVIQMTSGTILYTIITAVGRMLESMNIRRYGLEHTGIFGDGVMGSYYKQASDITNDRPTGRYSERLVHRLDKEKSDAYHSQFDEHEIYVLYTRAFQGIAGSNMVRKQYTETAAPYADVELFQLCVDIPAEKRIDHYIYKKWILAKHPEAAGFTWEKIRARINDPSIVLLLHRLAYGGPRKLLNMLKLNPGGYGFQEVCARWITGWHVIKRRRTLWTGISMMYFRCWKKRRRCSCLAT